MLAEVEDWHPYEVSLLISRLSCLYGENYSDVSVSYEDLVARPEPTLREIESALDCAGLVESELLGELRNTSVQRWKGYADENWFENAEQRVEGVIQEMSVGFANSFPVRSSCE